jgi:hypothetical protein
MKTRERGSARASGPEEEKLATSLSSRLSDSEEQRTHCVGIHIAEPDTADPIVAGGLEELHVSQAALRVWFIDAGGREVGDGAEPLCEDVWIVVVGGWEGASRTSKWR